MKRLNSIHFDTFHLTHVVLVNTKKYLQGNKYRFVPDVFHRRREADLKVY